MNKSKQLLKSEEGSILPIFAVVVVVLIIIMAVAIDFSRYVLASEKLKTAVDSAAISGAMTGKRYVRIEVYNRKYRDPCCSVNPLTGECRSCCQPCGPPITREGSEDDLIANEGFKKFCCSGCEEECRVNVLSRWVEYEDNGAAARSAAQMFFDLNKPKEMASESGGESHISSVEVYNRGTSLYPSVVVRAEGRLKALMLSFMDKMHPGSDVSELEASRCSQGGTFYYDANRKMHRAASSVAGCE